MLTTGLEYGVRALWTGAGLCAVTLGTVPETDWAVRCIMLLCGILTLLLSILLGGYVRHIVGHEAYSQTLYAELDRRAERLFKALHGTVSDAQCKSIQRAAATAWSGQLERLKRRLDALEDRVERITEGHAPAPKYSELHGEADRHYLP